MLWQRNADRCSEQGEDFAGTIVHYVNTVEAA